MKLIDRIPVLGRLIKEDKGQALVFTAVVLTAFMGVTGIAVDAGKGYYAYDLLKASTNAAALAGAAGLPNTTTAKANALAYGSETSKYNANGILTGVNTSVSFSCSSEATTELGVGCLPTPGTTGTGNNVIVVSQTGQSNNLIGPLFGMRTFNIQSTATGLMNGGAYIPYNIAVIIDTTKSMDDADSGTTGNTSCSYQIQCALDGFQTLLGLLYPCNSTGSCTSGSPKAVDNVALYVFPSVTTATVGDDDTCTSTSAGSPNYGGPTTIPYTFTTATAPTPNTGVTNMGLVPTTDIYQVVNFENGYKTTDAGTTLVSTDPLAIASGDGGKDCGILKWDGSSPYLTAGEGTYYAQVIYAAQAALYAESTTTGSSGYGYKKAMIILSDGNATATSSQMAVSSGGGTLNGTGSNHSYAYPSALGECGQAVVAAQAASAAGTTVFTIGYGTETTGSCTTDATYSATVSTSSVISSSEYGANTWKPGDQACQAIGAMATSQYDFYSDDYLGCTPVATGLLSYTSLSSIFTSIAQSFSTTRLVPNGWA